MNDTNDKFVKMSASGLKINSDSIDCSIYNWKEDSRIYRDGFRAGRDTAVREYQDLLQTVTDETTRKIYNLKEDLMALKTELKYCRQEAEGKDVLERMYIQLLDDLRNHFKEYINASGDVLLKNHLEDLAPYLQAKKVYFDALQDDEQSQERDGLFYPLEEEEFDEECPF